jgi:hypothetical protein
MFELPQLFRSMSADAFGSSVEEITERALTDTMLRAVTGNPRVKWRFSEGEGGRGRIAYAVLQFEASGRRVVLGAIEGGRVAEHIHVDGPEVVYTLAGVGSDIDTVRRFGVAGNSVLLTPGTITVHVAGTRHAPGSDSFWAFIYENYGTVEVTQPLK